MFGINACFLALLFLRVCMIIGSVINREIKNENWAVLVAGSENYDNYRHQSDVAHAYQVLLNGGFDRNKIITMMVDDVVNDDDNPHKGKLFNKPNGPDVYKGIKIDYKANKVTVGNFLGILNGKGKSGKVLKVKSTEKVFIFLSDHGSSGIFAFPDDLLTTNQLIKEVKNLANKSKGVTIFVESCLSGSLFLDHITPKDKNILAFSASNSTESSYACYWSDEMNTYLGDLFSVSWMESVEAVDPKKTKFFQLYNIVKKLTIDSHVLKFGDQTMLNLSLNEVFGSNSTTSKSNLERFVVSSQDRIASHDIQLYSMIKRCEKKRDQRCLHKIENLKKSIKKLEMIFNKLNIENEILKEENKGLSYNSPYPDHVYSCYKNSAKLFSKTCVNYYEVEKTFSYLGTFLKMCANRMDEKIIAALIKKYC